MNTIYQYQEVDLNDAHGPPRAAHEGRMMRLNKYGAEGWQLVSVLPNMVAIMMRTIEEPKPKRAYTRRQTETQDAAA